MLEKLTAADFTDYIGRSFEIHYGSDEVLSVVLAEVQESPYIRSDDPDARRGFSLLFQSAIREYLPQGIYRIAEPDFSAAHGPLEFFIVPLAPTAEGVRYEIIFG